MKFQVGDKIRCLEPIMSLQKNGIYTVKKVYYNYIDLEEISYDDLGISFGNFRFELVETRSQFQKGDKVRIKGMQDIWIVDFVYTLGDGVTLKLDDVPLDISSSKLELVEKAIQLEDRDLWVTVYKTGFVDLLQSNFDHKDDVLSTTKVTLKVPKK